MVARRSVAVVAVALLLTLGGCNALSPSNGTDDVTGDTVTPVPVTEGTPSPEPGPAATAFTGITENETVDVRALVESHERYLANRSFSLVWSRRSTGGSGPIARTFDRDVRAGSNSTYVERVNGSIYGGEVVTYASPEGEYKLFGSSNDSTVSTNVRSDRGASREEFVNIASDAAAVLVQPRATAISVVERDGRTYARLFSQSVPDYVEAIYGDYQVKNYTMTAWVAESGYIKTLFYEFTLQNAEERVRQSVRYLYSDVGGTTVSEPQWVSDYQREQQMTAVTPEPATPEAETPPAPDDDGTATPTPSRNATATPPANGNATATPTPGGNATATPNAGGTPGTPTGERNG